MFIFFLFSSSKKITAVPLINLQNVSCGIQTFFQHETNSKTESTQMPYFEQPRTQMLLFKCFYKYVVFYQKKPNTSKTGNANQKEALH